MPPGPEILTAISDGSCDEYVTSVVVTASDPVQAQILSSYGASDFPTEGDDFLILSSGDPFSPAMGGDLDFAPADLCGGDQVFVDITFDFDPNNPVQSILFDFDFFSYEFPEFVGTEFNDYVFAFLDGSPVTLNTSCEPSATGGGCLITFDQTGARTNVNNSFFELCDSIGCDDPNGTPGWEDEFVGTPGDDSGRTGTLSACTPLTCGPAIPPLTQGHTH